MDTTDVTLSLTDILSALPEHVKWTIRDSRYARLSTTDERGEVYWDDSDPANVGWAYRIVVYERDADYEGNRHPKREESGSIDSPADLAAWF